MDGHEQIRAVTARDLRSAPETDVVVAVADEDRLHAWGAIDLALERTDDGEHDVLLTDSRSGDRAGVFAAVTRINGDDHVAPSRGGVISGLLAHRRRLVRVRRPPDRRR